MTLRDRTAVSVPSTETRQDDAGQECVHTPCPSGYVDCVLVTGQDTNRDDPLWRIAFALERIADALDGAANSAEDVKGAMLAAIYQWDEAGRNARMRS